MKWLHTVEKKEISSLTWKSFVKSIYSIKSHNFCWQIGERIVSLISRNICEKVVRVFHNFHTVCST